MSLSDGFFEYYVDNRRSFAWAWGLTSAFVLICWLAHVVPYSYAGVASKGVVVSRSCGSKGFSYTYSYEVDGQTYTAQTQWGGWDGNGPCQKLVPGVEVPITYRMDDPSRSMGGTVGTWTKAVVYCLVGLAVLCFVVVPIPLYIKELLSDR